MRLDELPASYLATRSELQRVAVHVVARARYAATERFGLRVTPGGFGTPAFGTDAEVVRVSGGDLVRERAPRSRAATAVLPLATSTLSDAAAFVGVSLDTEFTVGDDTPAIGDTDQRLSIDSAAAHVLATWFWVGALAIDAVVRSLGAAARPSVLQVWPEHFDAGIDVAAAPEVRVNLGVSPGDGDIASPYLYVGPWDRDGLDDEYWNASFGAHLPYADVVAAPDAVAMAASFFERGLMLVAAREASRE